MINFLTVDSNVNIFSVDVDALVNPVNTVGVMGKGLALEFKKKFPDNYNFYKGACTCKLFPVGSVLVYPIETNEGKKYIMNFSTKKHWRDNSRLEYIEEGLYDLVRKIIALPISSIALPALGCGAGALNWKNVKPLMIKHLEPLTDVRILIFEPLKP